jgi:hypothetical protein
MVYQGCNYVLRFCSSTCITCRNAVNDEVSRIQSKTVPVFRDPSPPCFRAQLKIYTLNYINRNSKCSTEWHPQIAFKEFKVLD